MQRNRIHMLTSTVLFVLIIIAYLVMATHYPVAYIQATYEDFFGEWAQVFFFVSVFVLSLRLALYKSRYRIFFIVLALAAFYTVMEEISWGQRILDISSPELFRQYNLQRETNIHNFVVGPYSTTIKKVIEILLFAGLTLYGLVYPLALGKGNSLAINLSQKGLSSPPLYLWPYFVLAGIFELGIFRFNEAEIAEILIPLALSIQLLHVSIIRKKAAADHSDSGSYALDNSLSRRLVFYICILFIAAAAFSAGATYASYSSPRIRARMDSKMISGIEKFAGRYHRYNMWNNAVYLYSLLDEAEPGRPSVQRNLALCYQGMKDAESSEEYLDTALDIDMERLKINPASIAANLSIAETYRLTGNSTKENEHLEEALSLALQRSADRPGSAKSAYWLGKAYESNGDNENAFQSYKKAFELKPERKKYRKAYMKLKRQF